MAIPTGVLAPPDRHTCATPGSSERPRPASGGIGLAVLMEVKGVNDVILEYWHLIHCSRMTDSDGKKVAGLLTWGQLTYGLQSMKQKG